MERAALPVGAWLGDVEIVRVLAVGGFGIVYLARDHALGREVAVKEFMPAHLVERRDGPAVVLRSRASPEAYAEGLDAFMREARLLASLSHPAIVKVHRLWEAHGTGYMAMPYLRGPTLGDIRRSLSEPPTERWLRSVIDPLLDALAMMHAVGVCHRDIAPDNIVMAPDGLPVLLDFGAARHLDPAHTQSVTAVLKPCYAPIEQYADETHMRQGPWTDLYALGALVMFLIDGKPPPAAPSRCVHDAIAPLAQRRIAGISKRFLAATDWALQVKPQDRPQSVAALRDALRESARARPAAPRRGAWRDLRRPWLPVAAGGAFVAMAIAVWSAWPLAEPAAAPMSAVAAPLPMVAPRAGAADLAASPPVVLAQAATAAVIPASVASVSAVATTPVIATSDAKPVPTAAPATTRHATAKPAHRRAAPRRAPVEATVVALGPTEICAARNFFLRPYCVQRQCDLPRFAQRAECTQLRTTVARNSRSARDRQN